jgi:hypothetical protein
MITTKKAARLVLADEAFERLVAGEPLIFDMQPDTEKLIIKLHPTSKYLKSYHDIVSDIQRHFNLAPTKRI